MIEIFEKAEKTSKSRIFLLKAEGMATMIIDRNISVQVSGTERKEFKEKHESFKLNHLRTATIVA